MCNKCTFHKLFQLVTKVLESRDTILLLIGCCKNGEGEKGFIFNLKKFELVSSLNASKMYKKYLNTIRIHHRTKSCTQLTVSRRIQVWIWEFRQWRTMEKIKIRVQEKGKLIRNKYGWVIVGNCRNALKNHLFTVRNKYDGIQRHFR